MHLRSFRAIVLWIAVVASGTLACDLSAFGLGQASKPQIVIQAPATGSQFREGEDVSIQSTATDSVGVVRVELAVDGATVRTDAPPVAQGQKSFTLLQSWQATAGTHTLSVRAYNAAGAASEPAFISITVTPVVSALPTATLSVPTLPAITLLPTIPPNNATVAPTAAPATRTPTRPSASPTIAAPPGVYGISIRLDPTAPKRGTFVTFFVTFLNSTGSPQAYRWRIRLFEPDKRNSFGDTTPINSTLAVGTSEIASEANWRVTGPGDCMNLTARAFWIDPDSKQETEFLKPDKSGGPAAGFQVCP